MKLNNIKNRMKTYQITAILSIILTLVGFSYNVWRIHETEINSNIRTSSFELLKELASLEQIIYSAYYDKNKIEGNPRKAWVKVILINDLSVVQKQMLSKESNELKKVWSENWKTISTSKQSVDKTIKSIDVLRDKIKVVLKNLT